MFENKFAHFNAFKSSGVHNWMQLTMAREWLKVVFFKYETVNTSGLSSTMVFNKQNTHRFDMVLILV